MTAELTRRALLKDVALGAGATVLAPALARVAAHAAGDAKAASPRRVVFFVQSNGFNPAHVCPAGWKMEPNGNPPAGAKTVEVALKDRDLHPALAPLAPLKDKLTLVRGLSGKVSMSGHSTCHGALGAYPYGKGPMAQTVDAALADALPGVFHHVLVGLAGSHAEGGMNYSLSAAGPGRAKPVVCNPELAYQSLFGSVADGAGRAGFNRKTHLLDYLADDVKRSRAALAGPEREKLDGYVQAFETLHARQKELVAREEEIRRAAPPLGKKLAAGQSSLVLEAQTEIAAAALAAGLTNVVTLASGGGDGGYGAFPEFGLTDLHGMGHGAKFGRESSEACFVELRQFHCKQVVRLVEALSAVKEGAGTAMDNTLIVYLSDSGDGHHPRLGEWPVVLVGDLGGRLKKPGRFVQLPGYKQSKDHRTMASLWCTLLHAAGKPRDEFGLPDLGLKDLDQTGPVPDLLA